ncbi:cytochrome P450 6k1-like isoform X1 [Rhodnius prolixus]|uniref:cytochrome P450 6k1-like isoform X1 n=1 Tax=Rhodnius prolixus TaxID=13249 RepID=UPI003D18CBDF
MDFNVVTWALVVGSLTLIIYWYTLLSRQLTYWKRKNVAHLKPLPIIGNLLPVVLMKNSAGDLYKEAYLKFPNKKVVGLYELMKPVLVIKDPKLLERILVKDFHHFVDHGNMLNEGLFSNGLFQLSGTIWRSLRYKMSPAFTSGKLKMVFNGMLDCTEEMINLMKKHLHQDYEVQNALITFTIDVIANTVFGVQINDIIAREEFAKYGTSIFNVTPSRYMQMIMLMQMPKISKMLGFKFMNKDTEKYFKRIIKQTFDQRIGGQNQRNDYLNHLVKLKEKGVIEIQTRDEDDAFLGLDEAPPAENVEITDEILAGQAFQFLAAGFDPLFNTMMFVMFDMASFPKTQEKARQEIKQVLEIHGGYSYKAIKEMTYLEQCIQETLRLHPLTPFLLRTCTKTYTTYFGLEIEPGQKIIIPLSALHIDPQHFPDPEAYIPERQPPNTSKSNFTYLPFGDGPRMCIGLRFAMLELKLGLAKIIENFKFTLSPKTKLPLDMNNLSFILMPKEKVLFNLTQV